MDRFRIQGPAKISGQIRTAGAKNAALLAIRILSNSRPELREKLRRYHAEMVEQLKKDSVL